MMHAAGLYALPLQVEAMEAGWQSDPTMPPVGPSFAATATSAYLNQRKLSIFGGTNEIQKNIVAKMMGL
jgi:alkylation response protein AidB-like acyl-CoA dehydrogenase